MKIAVVAPSRSLSHEAADQLYQLKDKNPELNEVVISIDQQCFLSSGHFAGDDGARASAFLEAANDPQIDAVWFARGGYGAGRILPLILPSLRAPAAHKTYIGYSDTGYLLAALAQLGVGKSVHGPMVSDALRPGGEAALLRVLRWLALGNEDCLEPSVMHDKRSYAFNLTILASLAASEHLPNLDGSILLLEDIGEHLYAIDRALMTAFSSGRLDRLRGIRCGRFSDVPTNDIDFGQTAEDIVRSWCDRYRIEFLGSADIGHDADNKIVPFPIAFRQALLP
ncbi:MAG: LD-carboxypeptidase [Pseudomonadota bacterium]